MYLYLLYAHLNRAPGLTHISGGIESDVHRSTSAEALLAYASKRKSAVRPRNHRWCAGGVVDNRAILEMFERDL